MSYQNILNEYFLIKREVNPAYSLRAYARDLGIPSSNLSNVLKGKQGLSKETAEKIAARLKLEAKDRVQFLDMVMAQDGRKKRDKLEALARLEKTAINPDKRGMRDDFFKLISEWHYFALLELLTLKNCKSDVVWMAKKLKLPVETVKIALERLTRLELIKIEDGKYQTTNAQLDTSYDVPSSSIKKHNMQILKKATDALAEQPVAKREFSTLTVAINAEDVTFAKEQIRKFKMELDRELMTRANQKGADQVYCLGIQFFNLLEEKTP